MSTFLQSTCSPIDIGCVLEDGYGGFVPDGYYSNGVTWYLVSGGSGLVIDLGPCVTTTTTSALELYLANTEEDSCTQTGGQLLTSISYTGGPAYCDFTTLNSAEIPGLANGTYYVSDGTNVRSWTKASTPSNLYDPSVCSLCATTTTTTTTIAPGDVTYSGFFELVVDPTSEKAFRATDVSITGGHFPLTDVAIGASSGTINVTGIIATGDKALKIGVPPNPTPMVIAEIVSNSLSVVTANATISTDTSSGYLKVIITPNTAPSTVQLSGTLTVRYIAPITTTTTSTTTTTTTAYPYGDFKLDPQYGINITSLTASTGTLPSFTFPRNTGSSQTLDMVSAYSNGTVFTVGLSGTRLFGTNKVITLYVNSVARACQVITVDGSQTKSLTSSVAILDTDNVTIAIDNATSC